MSHGWQKGENNTTILGLGAFLNPSNINFSKAPVHIANSFNLHVGHEALLDSPAFFIDLFQEVQLIIITAIHGGENPDCTLIIVATNLYGESSLRAKYNNKNYRLILAQPY